ncbi:MAG: tetratricopeptide repeat protein, partial [Pedobacter sp.]
MRSCITIICLVICQFANTQTVIPAPVDSLVRSVPFAPDDSTKARLYNRIFNELVTVDARAAMLYGFAGLGQVNKMKWLKGKTIFYNNIGRSYSGLGLYDSAILYFELSLKHARLDKNQLTMANTYNNMAVAAQNIKADYPTAASYYFKSLELVKEFGDST